MRLSAKSLAGTHRLNHAERSRDALTWPALSMNKDLYARPYLHPCRCLDRLDPLILDVVLRTRGRMEVSSQHSQVKSADVVPVAAFPATVTKHNNGGGSRCRGPELV